MFSIHGSERGPWLYVCLCMNSYVEKCPTHQTPHIKVTLKSNFNANQFIFSVRTQWLSLNLSRDGSVSQIHSFSFKFSSFHKACLIRCVFAILMAEKVASLYNAPYIVRSLEVCNELIHNFCTNNWNKRKDSFKLQKLNDTNQNID